MSAYPMAGGADMAILSELSGILWGGPLLMAFLLVGGYYSLRTGFFQIFRFGLLQLLSLCLYLLYFSSRSPAYLNRFDSGLDYSLILMFLI